MLDVVVNIKSNSLRAPKKLNRGWKRTDSDFAKILCMNFL